MILNLTQHVATSEQEAQLVVEPRMTKEKIPHFGGKRDGNESL